MIRLRQGESGQCMKLNVMDRAGNTEEISREHRRDIDINEREFISAAVRRVTMLGISSSETMLGRKKTN